MADNGVVQLTKLRQVFSKTEPIETGDDHNIEIRLRRRVTRIRGLQVSDEAAGESEENMYIPPSIFRCFDELVTELKRNLCGRLDLNLDIGSINGLAEVVYHNLRGGVCDDVQHTVMVVIVEVEEVQNLPGEEVEEVQNLPGEDVEDEDDYMEDYEYEQVEEEEGLEREMMHLRIEVRSEDYMDPCAICWDVLPGGTGAMKLPCNHLFHEACIRAWLARNWTCPMCRRDVS